MVPIPQLPRLIGARFYAELGTFPDDITSLEQHCQQLEALMLNTDRQRDHIALALRENGAHYRSGQGSWDEALAIQVEQHFRGLRRQRLRLQALFGQAKAALKQRRHDAYLEELRQQAPAVQAAQKAAWDAKRTQKALFMQAAHDVCDEATLQRIYGRMRLLEDEDAAQEAATEDARR